MTDRPAILSAKMEKLAAIIEDSNSGKNSPPGQATAEDVRAAQAEAAREVMAAGGSVAAVENVRLPSERLQE